MRGNLLWAAMLAVLMAPSVASGQDRFFDSGGVRIRYIERGTGEPIVLLHGIGGSVQTWIDAGVLESLAVDHRVIAFDARGHGKSEKPHDPKQYGREMALDVVRLLDHMSLRRAHIVGYSMGAAITSQLLVIHPERFITATLGGGAARLRWTADDARLAEQEAVEREKECVSRTLIYRLAPVDGPKPSEAELKARSDACFADATQDRFALAALTRARGEQAISPVQVAAIRVPTLGIAGTADPLLAGLESMKKLRPALELLTLDGATHGGPRGAMGRPEFVAAIRQFIAAHRHARSQ